MILDEKDDIMEISENILIEFSFKKQIINELTNKVEIKQKHNIKKIFPKLNTD